MNKTILVVEDELKLANILVEYLQTEGFKTKHIDTGTRVIPWIKKNNPDLVLLDLMLPAMNGKDICQEIRTFSHLPVIMITAMVDEIDRLIGLEMGADDYICKPFSPKEVVARVKAVLRRIDPEYIKRNLSNGFEIDTERFSITLDGIKLDLTPVEFRLLAMFIEQSGRVYNRDQILNKIFDDGRIVLDRTVDTHIKNLRHKLKKINPKIDYIRSLYGVGYSFEN